MIDFNITLYKCSVIIISFNDDIHITQTQLRLLWDFIRGFKSVFLKLVAAAHKVLSGLRYYNLADL